ncbi:MAG: gamma-glutamyltransferase [Candidatus Palauibacterales bacterium]|nr:gamma-glutamyltransferase [Candidatus Palauibacterales bacterium]
MARHDVEPHTDRAAAVEAPGGSARGRRVRAACLVLLAGLLATSARPAAAQVTHKPVLHGKHWVAITGKPLSAEAGAQIFQEGGNAVDAACAMLAAGATMWDVLSWGGETQALIYDPNTKKVIGINALGVAPTGATAEFFEKKGLKYPPAYGPLAAVTPGTPGGLMTMLAEYGTMSLKQVLAPAIEMAENGYAMEAQTANSIEHYKDMIEKWKYSRALFLTHPGEAREAPHAGEVFRQPDLARTLHELVDSEQQALKQGKSRKQAIYAAYDRFYKGDIAKELTRSVQEQGGLITMKDLANWKVHIEEPVHTSYKGIEVYKLTSWVQGPVMLQVLNLLDHFDLEAMGLNSARYIHTIYQAMNLAYADRDFYYGDPYVPPAEPIQGLLSKDYAAARAKLIDPDHNDPDVKPGNPYDYQPGTNPFPNYLARWHTTGPAPAGQSSARPSESARLAMADRAPVDSAFLESFTRGTTSIEAAGPHGWVISVTPSGGWIPPWSPATPAWA